MNTAIIPPNIQAETRSESNQQARSESLVKWEIGEREGERDQIDEAAITCSPDRYMHMHSQRFRLSHSESFSSNTLSSLICVLLLLLFCLHNAFFFFHANNPKNESKCLQCVDLERSLRHPKCGQIVKDCLS